MASRLGYNLVARWALVPLATLLVAAGPPERPEREEKPACDQLPACRSLKAVGLESQAKGQLGVALERLRAAYALSQDYQLQAPLGRVLQQLGRGDDAFAAFQLFLKAAPYDHPLRPAVQKWLREVIESAPAEEAESGPETLSPPPPLPLCPPTKLPLARRISGGVLLGLGLGGLVAATVAYLQHGSPADGTCSFDGQSLPCVWDTRPAAATGFALSAASLVSGTLVLAWPISSGRKEAGGGSPCRKP